jgi:hypothetical protein
LYEGDIIAEAEVWRTSRDHGYKLYLCELILKQRKWFKLDAFLTPEMYSTLVSPPQKFEVIFMFLSEHLMALL